MFLSLPPQHNRTFLAVEVRPQEQYRPPHQVHAHPRVVEQRSDVIIRPDVIVDAVIDLHEAIRRVVEGLGTGCVTYDVLDPVLKVGALVECRGVAIFLDEVSQWSSPSPCVKGVSLVGNLEHQDTAGRERAVPVAQRRQGKWHVFEHVAGDDEVQASVLERQLAGIPYDIRRDDLLSDFRILVLQTTWVDPVDVPNLSSARNRKLSP